MRKYNLKFEIYHTVNCLRGVFNITTDVLTNGQY